MKKSVTTVYPEPWVTVWECTSPSSGEKVVVTHPAYPNDKQHAHEYQRILYRGPKGTPEYRKAIP